MKRLHINFLPTILITIALFFFITCKPAQAHIYNLQNNETITLDEMLTDLKETQIIFHGELHDRPSHHQSQLKLIKILHERGRNLVIGLEMFPRDRQNLLDQWLAGEISTTEMGVFFDNLWGYWDLYKDIFIYARRENIPMKALNIPREVTQKVARQGFDSLSDKELKKIPPVSCKVSKEYEEFVRRALGAHAQHPGTFENFCQAQLLWDKVMAKSILEVLEKDNSQTVFVLAGGGHAWKEGIPSHIAANSDYSYRVLLPEISGSWIPDKIGPQDADYILQGLKSGGIH